jgi:hypothetical protein
LNFFFVSLFQAGDVVGPFLGFLDFLPGFHFLLLQESNTIGQQLGVTINAKQKDRLVWGITNKCPSKARNAYSFLRFLTSPRLFIYYW